MHNNFNDDNKTAFEMETGKIISIKKKKKSWWKVHLVGPPSTYPAPDEYNYEFPLK